MVVSYFFFEIDLTVDEFYEIFELVEKQFLKGDYSNELR